MLHNTVIADDTTVNVEDQQNDLSPVEGEVDVEPKDIFDEEAVAESLATFYEVAKNITAAALPIAGSYTLSVQYFILGLTLVRLSNGEDELAANALIFKMFGFIFIALSPIFGAGISISNQRGDLERLESQQPGENHSEVYTRISGIGKSIFTVGGVMSPIAFFSLCFSESILTGVFRQDAALAKIAQEFLRIYSIAVPGIVARASLEQILYGFSKNMAALGIGSGGLGVTTILSLGLSYGWFGNAPMGKNGMAVGCVIEPYLTAAAYAVYIKFHPSFEKYHFLSAQNNKYVVTQARAVMKIGLPVAFTITTDTVSSMALSALLGITGGKQALGASAILNQYTTFNGMLKSATAEAVSLQVGRLSGAKQYKNASRYAHYGLLVSALWTTPAPLLFSAAPDLLVMMSGQTISYMSFMRQLAPILGLTQMMDCIRVNILNQLHAVNDNNIPAIITIAGLSSGIVTGALTGMYTDGGVFALTGFYLGGVTASATGMAIRWKYSTKPEFIKLQQEKQNAIFDNPASSTFFNCCSRIKNRMQSTQNDDEKQAIISQTL